MAPFDGCTTRWELTSLRVMASTLNRLPSAVSEHPIGLQLATRYRERVAALLEDSGSRSADRPEGNDAIPPPVTVDLAEPLRDYWIRRVDQTEADWYAGVRIGKFPEDLRVYEHLIWMSRPTVVIEIGVQYGGSALWFRDRLRAAESYGRIGAGHVIAIDIDTTASREGLAAADPNFEQSITLIDGDVRDPALPARIEALIPPGARCLVVEDSAHSYSTTIKALCGFAHLVPMGGFYVVEDGCVDIAEMRLRTTWPRGVIPAIAAWLQTEDGARFNQRRDLEMYGMSCHPYGFLERVAPDSR